MHPDVIADNVLQMTQKMARKEEEMRETREGTHAHRALMYECLMLEARRADFNEYWLNAYAVFTKKDPAKYGHLAGLYLERLKELNININT